MLRRIITVAVLLIIISSAPSVPGSPSLPWSPNFSFTSDPSSTDNQELLTYTDQQVQYFDQILDHFSYLPPKFWKQRYFVNQAHFSAKNGPVFLVICGEGPCSGLPDQYWISTLAQSEHALVIALQHRYYGDSLPFRAASFQNANLKYLSSRQALKDLAFFIQQVRRNRWYGISEANKWITVGGSYSGALSAWFRAKYPHLTVGALASSAVILSIDNFREFDEQIYLSAEKSGSFCPQAIQQLTAYAQEKSQGPDHLSFQRQYGAEKLTSREFMFYWSDVIVYQIQMGSRSAFCNSLKNKTFEQQLQVFKQLALKISPTDYGAYYLADPAFALQNGGGARSWYYQSCTEFGFFQTYSQHHPMRSKMLNIDFYRKWCEDIYGYGTWPDVNRTNLEFGGLLMRATNLFVYQGIEDPWKWASWQSNYKNVTVRVANCTDCSHCRDILVPNKNDPKELTAIRTLEASLVKSWIGGK